VFEKFPSVDVLKEVIRALIEDPFKEEGPAHNGEGERGRPLAEGVIEPAQHCHLLLVRDLDRTGRYLMQLIHATNVSKNK